MSKVDHTQSLWNERLGPFLQDNPYCSVERIGGALAIVRPWNDSSLVIRLPAIATEQEELIRALNAVHLPPRFTAICHRATTQIEFIYFPLKTSDSELHRKFQFVFRGRAYQCSFAPSSSQLLSIARNFRPARPSSETEFRNLPPFRDFQRTPSLPKGLQQFFSDRVPTSFFVEPIGVFDEEQMVDFALHMNFYVRYFDRDGPTIVVHDVPLDVTQGNSGNSKHDRNIYISGGFPSVISARETNPALLRILRAAENEDSPRVKYLYYYQVTEYCSFYFIDKDVRDDIRKILTRPDIVEAKDTDVGRLIDIISNLKATDKDKLQRVIETRCDPHVVWKELAIKSDYFSSTVDFDGGFSTPPLIPKGCTEESFCAIWLPKLSDVLYKIRNALVSNIINKRNLFSSCLDVQRPSSTQRVQDAHYAHQ